MIPWNHKLKDVLDGFPDISSYINANLPYSVNIPIIGADDCFQDKNEVTCRTVYSYGGCNDLSFSDDDKNTAAVGAAGGVSDRNSYNGANIPYSVKQLIMLNTENLRIATVDGTNSFIEGTLWRLIVWRDFPKTI